MKNPILLLLALVGFVLGAGAQPPVVAISSLTSVTVNGVQSGTVVDVLAKGGDAVRGPLLDALIAYDAARVKAVKDSADAVAADDRKASLALLATAQKAATTAAAEQAAADSASASTVLAAAQKSVTDAAKARDASDAARVEAENKAAALATAVEKLAIPVAFPPEVKKLMSAARVTAAQRRKAELEKAQAAIASELSNLPDKQIVP